MKKHISLTLGLFLAMSLFFAACSKEDNNDGTPTTLNVNLTSAASDSTVDSTIVFSSINIDLMEVRVKFTEEPSNDTTQVWQTLTTKAGIYNLLALQAGDTSIATGLIAAESISGIQIVLGENNSITVGDVDYPLTIPSGAETGLTLTVNKDLTQPQENITIDFNALLSISLENGEYVLRPVLNVE